MQKRLRPRYVAFFAALLSLSILCSACGSINAAPRLETNSQGLPQISGMVGAGNINNSLRTYFEQVNAALHAAEAESLGANMQYSLISDNRGYVLQARLAGSAGQYLPLPDIPLSGNLKLPDTRDYATTLTRDSLSLRLNLAARGCETQLFDAKTPLSAQTAQALAASYYEFTTNSVINSAAVARPDITDPLRLKALALIPDMLEGYEPQDALGAPELVSGLDSLVERLLFEEYGLGSGGFGTLDLAWMFSLYHSIFALALQGSGFASRWQAFGTDVAALLQNSGTQGNSRQGLTRGEIASMFAFSFQQYFPNIPHGPLTGFIDGENADAAYCVALGLMRPFPRESMFYENYESRYYELPSLTGRFLSTCFDALLRDAPDEAALPVAETVAIDSLMLLDSAFAALPFPRVSDTQKQQKINDRDYDWYFRQQNSGPYAAVNCMPAMTAAAIKWVHPDTSVSVESLREGYLPEYDDGWWMAQVVGSLKAWNVSFTYAEISTQAVVRTLDSGGIVLVMFTESAPGAQGHCELIYGYARSGNSLRFLVHDPGFDGMYRADGYPGGKARWLDASYLGWTVERINRLIVNVPAQ